MPPVTKPSQEKYDYVIIGGGSGASGSGVCFLSLFDSSHLITCIQRRAAIYGKKVAVVEATGVLGGCCVKVGEYIPRTQNGHLTFCCP